MTSIKGNFPEKASILEIREASQPEISVVIPTVPSSDHSKVCEILQNQSFSGEYEIFVINDANIDISEARNAGLVQANAEVVAFTDDDCIPASNWLKSLHREFGDNDIVCLEGQVKGGITYSGANRYVGCNLAVDRSSALAVGGFRSEFAGWRDDTEFGWRMERDAEGDCTYSLQPVVVHPTRPRATFVTENEQQLKSEYPEKYNKVMNNNISARIYRKMQKHGIINMLNALRFENK